MALPEPSPQQVGTRIGLVATGCGLSAEDLRKIWGYSRVSSVYLILGGKQPPKLSQLGSLARRAEKRGEWREFDAAQLTAYMQGLLDLTICTPLLTDRLAA